MNLFLGVFVPHKNRPALWERDAPHDVYLHAPEICRSVHYLLLTPGEAENE